MRVRECVCVSARGRVSCWISLRTSEATGYRGASNERWRMPTLQWNSTIRASGWDYTIIASATFRRDILVFDRFSVLIGCLGGFGPPTTAFLLHSCQI